MAGVGGELCPEQSPPPGLIREFWLLSKECTNERADGGNSGPSGEWGDSRNQTGQLDCFPVNITQ